MAVRRPGRRTAPLLFWLSLIPAIIRDQGSRSVVATAIGRDVKGKLSPLLYAAGIGLSFEQVTAPCGMLLCAGESGGDMLVAGIR